MCCLALSAAALGPRFAVVFWWIFGAKPDAAFDTFIWPLLGVVFAPWTTLGYLIAWQPGGLTGADWIWVVLGIVADVATYSGKAAANRYQTSSV